MVRTLDRIGGRWKPIILHLLRGGWLRFSDLHRAMPVVTRSVLARQLHELAADDLIERRSTSAVPPRVDYRLTAHGHSLEPALDALYAWGRTLPAGSTAAGKRITTRR